MRRFFNELSVAGNGGFVVVDVAFEYAGVGLSDHGNGGQRGGVVFAVGCTSGLGIGTSGEGSRQKGGNQGGADVFFIKGSLIFDGRIVIKIHPILKYNYSQLLLCVADGCLNTTK